MPASLKSQRQERQNHRHRRIVQMFGMPTPKGTKPRVPDIHGEPFYKAPLVGYTSFGGWLDDALSLLKFKWLRRAKQEELVNPSKKK